MATTTRTDSKSNSTFRIEIDGVALGGVSECSGLGSENEVIRYREGNDVAERLLPGRTTYSAITLKRGITADLTLWNWYKQTVDGKVNRRSVVIVLLDDERKDVARWAVRNGFPAKYTGPTFNATSNEVAIETLEIAHEGIERAQ